MIKLYILISMFYEYPQHKSVKRIVLQKYVKFNHSVVSGTKLLYNFMSVICLQFMQQLA